MQKVSSGSIKGILFLAVFVMGCLIFVVGILAVIFLPLYFNAGLVEAMEIINNDPAVAEMFGSPIRQGIFVTGNTRETQYGAGNGGLSTSISGPKGRGDVAISITKSEGGDWQVFSMSIRVDRKLALVWDASERVKGFHVVAPTVSPSDGPPDLPTRVPTTTQAPPAP
jgi:hypothetical protein